MSSNHTHGPNLSDQDDLDLPGGWLRLDLAVERQDQPKTGQHHRHPTLQAPQKDSPVHRVAPHRSLVNKYDRE
jgi:hypothetical protein